MRSARYALLSPNLLVLTMCASDYPTKDFINKYMDIYTNANLTTWEEAGKSARVLYELDTDACTGKTFPKNKLIDQC